MSSRRWDPERTKGYSDAVLGIVATILVVPLANIPSYQVNAVMYEKDVTLASTLSSEIQVRSFLIFWGVFLVIVFAWMRHARAFDGLDGVDSFLVTANWLELLAISSLPFFATTAAATTVASGGKTDAVPDLSLNILMIAVTHCFFLFLAIWYCKERQAAIRCVKGKRVRDRGGGVVAVGRGW